MEVNVQISEKQWNVKIKNYHIYNKWEKRTINYTEIIIFNFIFKDSDLPFDVRCVAKKGNKITTNLRDHQ